MSDDILTRAYEMIENGQTAEAEAMLQLVLEEDEHNVDALWLYAHAVGDVNHARDALSRILRFDPEYPGARELMERLRSYSPPPAGTFGRSPREAVLPPPPEFDSDSEFDFFDDLVDGESLLPFEAFDAFDDDAGKPAFIESGAFVVSMILLAIMTFIGVGVALYVIEEEDDDDRQLRVASLPTVAAISAESQAAAPTTIDVDAVQAALSAFTLSEERIQQVETRFGTTLVGSVCTTAGRELREALPRVINAMAQQLSTGDTTVNAIAARMVNCGTRTELLAIAAPAADGVAFVRGNLTDEEFQARWRPLVNN